MSRFVRLTVGIGAMILAGPAMANTLVILPQHSLANLASAKITGDHNVLHIAQNFRGSATQPDNQASITIEGNGNGAGHLSLSNGRHGPTLEAPLLSGGLIEQSGFGNNVALTVAGSANLFNFTQNGSANAASGSMVGLSNQAMVHQTGQNNIAAFSQMGNGNIVNISQTSW